MTRTTPPPPTAQPASDFDSLFAGPIDHTGFSRVLQIVDPAFPADVDAYSFLSADLLAHIGGTLALRHGDVVADLGCGSAGPSLWLARQSEARLIGVDLSPVAVARAAQRHAKQPDVAAAFLISDLESLGLANHSVSAVLSIDALQYPTNRQRAVHEARRVLRPGGRLVLTGWHPHAPGDPRLPERHRRTDWPATLVAAGFTAVRQHARSAWSENYQRIYQVALDLDLPGDDPALAALQSEARRRSPTAHLLQRVLISGTAP